MPKGAKNAVAVLSVTDSNFQNNSKDYKAYQYWSNIDASGSLTTCNVKAGTYSLTIYADGILGDYIQDNIVIKAGSTASVNATWTPESAGTELWRIGTPDRSSGEF